MSLPSHLYKYRRFSQNVLQELCDGSIYFASPASFNDPLDTNPSFVNDLSEHVKQDLFSSFYREWHPSRDPDVRLAEMRYLSSEHEEELREAAFDRMLCREIEDLFLKELRAVGIISLAEKWNCPLMWSHYADQHAGLCLEFSTKDHVAKNLGQVRYEGSRSIRLSDLADWKLNHNKIARKIVLETAFLSKAPAWSYEREWRTISRSSGLHAAPLELTSIYFGARCPPAVQTMLVKTLHSAFQKLSFYDIRFDLKTFDLQRFEVDIDEVIQTGIRASAALIFGRQMSPYLPPGAIALPEPHEGEEGEPYFQG